MMRTDVLADIGTKHETGAEWTMKVDCVLGSGQ